MHLSSRRSLTRTLPSTWPYLSFAPSSANRASLPPAVSPPRIRADGRWTSPVRSTAPAHRSATEAAFQGLGVALEEVLHLLGGLEVELVGGSVLGARKRRQARRGDENLVQSVVRGSQVGHLVGCQCWNTVPLGEQSDLPQPPPATGRPVVGQLRVEVVPERVPQRPKRLRGPFHFARENGAREVAEGYGAGETEYAFSGYDNHRE